jgi:hypothetical protein
MEQVIMSILTEKTAALVDAVQQYEQKAQELLNFRNAIETAHYDLGVLLSPPEQPAQQAQAEQPAQQAQAE